MMRGVAASGARWRFALFLWLICLGPTGCDSGGEDPSSPARPQLTEEQERQLSLQTRGAWYLAEPIVARAEAGSQALRGAVEALLEAPSAETLGEAQKHWRQLASEYSALDIYSTFAHLTPDASAGLRRLDFAIAARPIEPGYLDSIGPYRYSGLVHDVSLPLSASTLREQHGLTQSEDAALGLYALEFMLFGDRADQPRQPDDYRLRDRLTADERHHGYTEPTELPENRRRQLLKLQAELLVEDLQRLASLWRAQTPDSLYLAFVQLEPQTRYNLLLRSAQVEIAEALAQLTPAAEEGANPAYLPPEGALAKEVALLAEVARVMRLDENLRRELAQAAELLPTDETAAREQARGHLENASLLLAAELNQVGPDEIED